MLAIEIIIVFLGILYIFYLIGGGKDNQLGGLRMVISALLIIFVPYFILKVIQNEAIAIAVIVLVCIVVPISMYYLRQDPEKIRERNNLLSDKIQNRFAMAKRPISKDLALKIVSDPTSPLNTKINSTVRDGYEWLCEKRFWEIMKDIEKPEDCERVLGIKLGVYSLYGYRTTTRYLACEYLLKQEGLELPRSCRPSVRTVKIVEEFNEALKERSIGD